MGGKSRGHQYPGFNTSKEGVSTSTQTQPDVPAAANEPHPSTPQKSEKDRKEQETAPTVNKKNFCSIRGIAFESPADVKFRSDWVDCAKSKCTYWVHCRCAGIYYPADQCKGMSRWAKDHFFCSVHFTKC